MGLGLGKGVLPGLGVLQLTGMRGGLAAGLAAAVAELRGEKADAVLLLLMVRDMDGILLKVQKDVSDARPDRPGTADDAREC